MQPRRGAAANHDQHEERAAVDGDRGAKGKRDVDGDPKVDVVGVPVPLRLDPVRQPDVGHRDERAVDAAHDGCDEDEAPPAPRRDVRAPHCGRDRARLPLLQCAQVSAGVVLPRVADLDHRPLAQADRLLAERRPLALCTRAVRLAAVRAARLAAALRRVLVIRRAVELQVLLEPGEGGQGGRHRRGAQLGVRPAREDASRLHEEDLVRGRQVLRLVRHEQPRLAGEQAVRPEDPLEEVLAHVRVDGGERVVEQVDVRVRVDGACERDPRLLASRDVDALLADLRHVAAREDLQVGAQRARLDHRFVPFLVHRRAKQDVATHRVRGDEGRLRRVCHRAVEREGSCVARLHLSRLHLAKERDEERGLARPHRAGEHRQLAALELDVEVDQGRLGGRARAARRVLHLVEWRRLHAHRHWVGARRLFQHGGRAPQRAAEARQPHARL
mmetsp:Transcript_14911/g.50171  ORF Transcript_14911/g.50171 Transcript_14911/m.50171 type:complete len:444 (-) Transcript_14911:212-1543(-)